MERSAPAGPLAVAQPQPEPGPLDPRRATTNFVIFRVRGDRAAFLAALKARGVLMVEYTRGSIRAVTHYGITTADIEKVLAASTEALREMTAAATTTLER